MAGHHTLTKHEPVSRYVLVTFNRSTYSPGDRPDTVTFAVLTLDSVGYGEPIAVQM